MGNIRYSKGEENEAPQRKLCDGFTTDYIGFTSSLQWIYVEFTVDLCRVKVDLRRVYSGFTSSLQLIYVEFTVAFHTGLRGFTSAVCFRIYIDL